MSTAASFLVAMGGTGTNPSSILWLPNQVDFLDYCYIPSGGKSITQDKVSYRRAQLCNVPGAGIVQSSGVNSHMPPAAAAAAAAAATANGRRRQQVQQAPRPSAAGGGGGRSTSAVVCNQRGFWGWHTGPAQYDGEHMSCAVQHCPAEVISMLTLGRDRCRNCGAKDALVTFPRTAVPAPGNIYVTPLRFKLGGHPVLSARFNVETAGSERKRPEI